MVKTPKEFSALASSQVENTLRFAELSLESSERLARLQMEAARRAFEDNAEVAKALTETTDPQDIVNLRSKLAQKNVESMLSYSKEIYETALQSRSQLMELLNESLGGISKEIQAATEKTMQGLPGGGSSLNAVQAVMAAANSAAENLFKLAAQASAATSTMPGEKSDQKPGRRKT